MLRNEGLNNEIFMFRFAPVELNMQLLMKLLLYDVNKENKILKVAMK